MSVIDDSPQIKVKVIEFLDIGNSNAPFIRNYVYDEEGALLSTFDIDRSGAAYTVVGPIQKENSGTTVLDVTGIETTTTLVDNGNGTFTYTNEDSTAVTVSVGTDKEYWHGKGGAIQTLNTNVLTVTNLTETLTSSGTVFSLAANILTVNKAGDYIITYSGTGETGDGGRRDMFYDLYVNGVKQGAESWLYMRNNASDKNTGSNRVIISLSVGDAVELRMQKDSAGSVITVPAGISMTVEEK